MDDVMRKILCLALCFLVACLMTGSSYKAHPYPDDPLLSLIPPDITLREAFEKYPEIMARFPVKQINTEDAEKLKGDGVRIFTLNDIADAEEILAVPFLSAFSWRLRDVDGTP